MIDEPITAARLAELLQVSDRHLRRLMADGWIRKDEDGFHRMSLGIRGYRSYLEDQGRRREERDGARDQLRRQRTRLISEQANSLAIKNAALRRTLLPRQEVLRTWATFVEFADPTMLAVPAKVAARLPHLTQHDLDEVRAEIESALAPLRRSSGHSWAD